MLAEFSHSANLLENKRIQGAAEQGSAISWQLGKDVNSCMSTSSNTLTGSGGAVAYARANQVALVALFDGQLCQG